MSKPFRLTAIGFYADFLTVPCAVVALAGAQLASGVPVPASWAWLVPSGALVWTLAEYWIHRLAFHGSGRYARDHQVHHQRPADYVGVSGAYTALIGVVVFASLWWAFGRSAGGAIMIGLLLGYLAYIGLHGVYHHARVAPGHFLYAIMRRHDLHHAGIEANYGVSSSLWDRVFGTLVPARQVRPR